MGEKVLPFYLSRDLLTEFEEGDLDFGDEELKEEIRKELTDVGIDEWTYLDNFFKRYNKVKLDSLAIEQVNHNHVPVKRLHETKVYVEAAHHVNNAALH